jgi:hypothetical protein
MKSAKSKSTPSKSPGKSEEKRLDNEKLDEIMARNGGQFGTQRKEIAGS